MPEVLNRKTQLLLFVSSREDGLVYYQVFLRMPKFCHVIGLNIVVTIVLFSGRSGVGVPPWLDGAQYSELSVGNVWTILIVRIVGTKVH